MDPDELEIELEELENVEVKKEDKQTYIADFDVKGMTCASCSGIIENTLRTEEGVLSVYVSLLTEKATVTYERPQDENKINELINDLGFTSTLIDKRETHLIPTKISLIIPEIKINKTITEVEKETLELTKLFMDNNGVKSVNFEVSEVGEYAQSLIVSINYYPSKVGIRTLLAQLEKKYRYLLIKVRDQKVLLKDRERKKLLFTLAISALLSLPLLFIMLAMILTPDAMWMDKAIFSNLTYVMLIEILVATPIQFVIGSKFYKGAWKSLSNKTANMDVLVSMATSISYFYSIFNIIYGIFHPDYHVEVFFETSGLLITFILLGKYLELVAKGKTSEAISKLMDLKASEATLLISDHGDNQLTLEEKLPTDLLQIGDILKILPGEKIPADGEIVLGRSVVDQSMISGEAMPVTKTVGQVVIGSTINKEGMIHIRTIHVGNDTSLSCIIRLVEEAQSSKAPIQRYADKISSIFVPVVISIAFATFLFWWFFTGTSIFPESLIPDGSNSFEFSLLLGISVIVIACPCALGLATPTAVMVGTGMGALNGILIKGGQTLETACKLSAVIFDKTGTLTEGKLTITDYSITKRGMKEDAFFNLVASVETGSEHPIARAIVDFAKLNSYLDDKKKNDIKEVKSLPGYGVQAIVNGTQVSIGNRRLMQMAGVPAEDITDDLLASERESKTVIMVAEQQSLVGTIAISDRVRDEALATILELKKRNIGIWMMTGDNKTTANSVAKTLQIDNVFAEVLPEEKAGMVHKLQSEGHIVAMVGDGINDSPALAAANIGISVGAGTDIAMEAAGMILVESDLRNVVTAIDLSSVTFNRIKLNYAWALIYNLLGIPLAAGILVPWGIIVPPVVAGAAMAFSSVSVVCSSLMLRTYRKPHIPVVTVVV